MNRPRAPRREPFDSQESVALAVRERCLREYVQHHGFAWPWVDPPRQEWAIVTPDKTVKGAEIRKKIEACAAQFLACAADAYEIAEESDSVSATSLKRLADAVVKSRIADLVHGGKVAAGREVIVATARGNEWVTGITVPPRQLAVVSLLYGNWPSQVTVNHTVAEVIEQEAKAIRLWLQRCKRMAKVDFAFSADLAGGPPLRLAWTLHVTQVNQAGWYAITEALYRRYEAHPEEEKPPGFHRADPPRDLASLLATRHQQAAAMRLFAQALPDSGDLEGILDALYGAPGK